MAKKKLTIQEVSNELGAYTMAMSDEWQEGVDALRACAGYLYCYSEEFKAALEKELNTQYKYITKNAIIEEQTETYTQTHTVVKWLE